MIIDPETVEVTTGSSYPAPFADQIGGRRKRALGDALGLTNYGVNLVERRHPHPSVSPRRYLRTGARSPGGPQGGRGQAHP